MTAPADAPAPAPADPYRDRVLPVWSWALYDFANTIYSAVVVTQFLPKVLARATGGDSPMAVAGALALVVSALVGPFLGAVVDATGGARSRVLGWSAVCCLGAIGLSLVPEEHPGWLMTIFILATVGYNIAISVYDAFLPDLCSAPRMGYVSGLGVGVGYLGALLGYPVALLVARTWGEGMTFAAAGVLMALFSVPFALFVREPPLARPRRFTPGLGLTEFRRAAATLRELPSRPPLALFLAGNFLAVDSLNSMIQWVAQFFRSGWDVREEGVITGMLIGLSLAGAAAGVVAGRLADRLGADRILIAAVVSLAGVALTDAFVTHRGVALTVTVLGGGFGAAGVWLSGRRMLVDLVPRDRLAEHMGLLGLTRKASVFGTLMLGVLADSHGWKVAIACLAVPLALGAVLLEASRRGVAGERAARDTSMQDPVNT